MKMSGKAYTMKEMKAIVDYLVEHKAYGLIRGRKMWVDFANSSSTIRSWQSLKETFLKRILPDIHNPYYKLSKDQIRSFRSGNDVEEVKRNKLEMEESRSNAETPNGIEKPSTSKQNGEENAPGENIPSKISSRNKSSVDTVILDTCYETAEDVLRDLESPNKNGESNEEVTPKSPCKSLRDLITYSEPLTPMLQEVLHDFDTDDDSDSGKMQIVENAPESDDNGNKSPRRVPDPIIASTKEKENEKNEGNAVKDESNESEKFVEPKVKSLRLRKRKVAEQKTAEKPAAKRKSSDKQVTNAEAEETETLVDHKTSSNEKSLENNSESSVIILNDSDERAVHKLTTSNAQTTQNCSGNTTDTVLPNNQEALDSNKLVVSNNVSSDFNKTDVKVDSQTRRRTVSRDLPNSQGTSNENKSNLKQTPLSCTEASPEKAKSDNSGITNTSETANQQKNTIAIEEQSRKSSEMDTQDILPPNKTAKELTPTPASQINPCLQSVSLFAEQFNVSNYLDSESSNDVNPSPESTRESTEKPVPTIGKENSGKEVVMLKSHSETESDNSATDSKNKRDSQVVAKSKKDKVLANMFGFSSGTATSKRKRLPSYRKNVATLHYHGHNSSGESSEWTSESDSDYVSPPRGRRNRQTRKYLKPKSLRIHSLEDEGGLFVMYGKKIYPLVKDGRTIKNYVVYSPDSDPDDEENYWKQKYVEERKRVEELKKVIKHSKDDDVRDSSPLLPLASTKPSRTQTRSRESRTKAKAVSISDSDKDILPKEEKQQKSEVVATSNNKTLKITFAKDNQKVHLEGHWSQLHPVLADVVEIFHKDTNGLESCTKKSESSLPEVIRNKSPADPDVHEKVNQLETEIFKEIEERDQQDTATKDPVENVTKRKRVNRIPSTTTEESNAQAPMPDSTRSSKRAKISDETEQVNKDIAEQVVEEKEVLNKEEQKGIETPLVIKPSRASVTPRKTRTPKKDPKGTQTPKAEAVPSNEVKPKTRKSKLTVPEEVKKPESEDDSEIRYMFPPTKKSPKTSVVKSQPTKRYSISIRNTFSPPGSSQHSESTQGYQDSDVSPPKLLYRRKRKLSLSTVVSKNKNKQNRLRKSLPIITNEHSSDSNNSYHIILKQPSECSSLKSDDYRSESYQLLMANRKNIILQPLEKIDEYSPTTNKDFEIRNREFSSNSELVKSKISINITKDLSSTSSPTNPEGGNSSSVSLPLSPEISIVENLSVSKELLKCGNDHPTLNELDVNSMSNITTRNKYLISQVDVSMPLMEQQCDVYRDFDENLKCECTYEEANKPAIGDSVLDNINTVNVKENPSMSDSLDTRLKNLLLESAKKMSISEECNISTNNEEVVIKPKAKRCSTPRKKRESQPMKLTKVLKVDPVIEECMEFCSAGGRKSCPPSIHVIANETEINNVIKGVTADKQPKDKSKVKKKKDIIKVKITRPSKDKKRKSSNGNNSKLDKTMDKSSISINRESNDNESGISSQDFSDGIDLIHNHSETCLHANDCIGDSVEFLELTAKSIISVNSGSCGTTSGFCGCTQQRQLVFQDCEDISLFCNNAQDGSTPYKVKQFVSTEASGETVYHSPSEMSQNSLITEDLSDEVRSTQSTKWYLLSEDETNTNFAPPNQNSFGANLKQLFPITCAIPDLSTITEMSKENDSRKPTLEGTDYDSNTMNDINSQSVFDVKL